MLRKNLKYPTLPPNKPSPLLKGSQRKRRKKQMPESIQNRPLTPDETQTIYLAAQYFAWSFTFGYYSRKDLEQEAFLYVLEAIRQGKYDEARPLRAFAYNHIRNRLTNKKRNEFYRPVGRCECCPSDTPCPARKKLHRLNSNKRSLMCPGPLLAPVQAREEESPEYRDLCRFILERLGEGVREDYSALKDGYDLTRDRTEAVRSHVSSILEEYHAISE
jgi:hypothetical protein